MDKVMDESYPPLPSNKCELFVISNMKNNVWDEKVDVHLYEFFWKR
jgi:hypothetical protein